MPQKCYFAKAILYLIFILLCLGKIKRRFKKLFLHFKKLKQRISNAKTAF